MLYYIRIARRELVVSGYFVIAHTLTSHAHARTHKHSHRLFVFYFVRSTSKSIYWINCHVIFRRIEGIPHSSLPFCVNQFWCTLRWRFSFIQIDLEYIWHLFRMLIIIMLLIFVAFAMFTFSSKQSKILLCAAHFTHDFKILFETI